MDERPLKLSWATINCFVGTGKRPFCEGEAVLDANHIMCCGYKSRSATELVIFALCLKTSALMQLPHKIVITLLVDEDNIVSIGSCSCGCKAGSGNCKHIVAVLMLLNRSLDLEDVSCTDMEQQWGKIKEQTKTMYEAAPLFGACHFKSPVNPYQKEDIAEIYNDELNSHFQNLLLDSAPDSEAALHINRLRNKASSSSGTYISAKTSQTIANNEDEISALESFDQILERNGASEEVSVLFSLLSNKLSPEENEFFCKNVSVTAEEAKQLCASTVSQNNALWLRERKKRITGSICYSLYTYQKSKSPDWEKKIKSLMNSTFKGNEHTRRGLQSEPAARAAYSLGTGKKITKLGLVVNPHAPWLGFSPDGITTANDKPCLIEIKTLMAGTTMTSEAVVKECSFISEDRQLKQKHVYYGQIQLGMELLKVETCHLILYAPFDDTWGSIHEAELTRISEN